MSSVTGVKRRFSDVGEESTNKKINTKTDLNNDISILDENTGLSKCFHRIRTKMYLSLAPCYLEQPIEGLRQQHLDTLIMTYNSKLNGVIISYDNIKLSKDNENTDKDSEYKYLGKVSDENPFSFIWCYVDFVIWRPKINDYLEGYIILQSASHIGLLIHDVFNATIKKFNIPESWEFVPNQADDNNSEENGESSSNSFKKLGHWCDDNGAAVDGKIKFKVRSINVNGKGLSVEGTLLTPENEKDTQPVVLENTVKENIKKHISFDDEAPITTDVNESSIAEEANNEETGDEDDAPKYNDEGSSDSDSDSDSEKKSSTDSSNSDSSDDEEEESSNSN